MPVKHSKHRKNHKSLAKSLLPQQPAPMMINQLSEMQPFETTPSATPLKLQPFAPMPPPSNAANDTSSMFADY